MCHESSNHSVNNCECKPTKTPGCCCAESPVSETKRKHMTECMTALRKKADLIEEKLSE
jgi:hypothetical protein